jgi:hypothetical protein
MAWTQSDVDALDTAIKAGVRSVTYGDRSVTYHSLSEMLTLRREMKEQVNITAATTTARCTYGTFAKG